MKTTDINDILTSFIDNRELSSLLIDGPWGCGKTFQIRNFLNDWNKGRKNRKRPRVYYLSLFGLDTIDKLNTALFSLTNKKTNIAIGVAQIISKAIPAIPYAGYAGDSLGYALNLIEKKPNCPVIIFDDLERVSEKLSYTDLLGYFSQLFLGGAKIVCVCDSSRLGDREKEFFCFVEKVFDRYFVVNQTTEDVINEMFEDLHITNFQAKIKDFGPNLRTAKRIHEFFISLKKDCDQINIPLFEQLGEPRVLDYLIVVVRSVLESSSNDRQIEGDHSGLSIISSLFGNRVEREIYSHWHNGDEENRQKKEKDVDFFVALLSVYLYRDYSRLRSMFSLGDESERFISCFFMSDQEKTDFSQKLLSKLLSENSTIAETDWDHLVDAFRYVKLEISDEERLFLAKRYLRGKMEKGANIQTEISRALSIGAPRQRSRAEEADRWKDALIKGYQEIILEEIRATVSIEQLDYDYLLQLIKKVFSFDKEKQRPFIKLIIENNFFLPDLSGSLSPKAWDYCFGLVEFAKKAEVEQDLLKVLSGLMEGNQQNFSLAERIDALKAKTRE